MADWDNIAGLRKRDRPGLVQLEEALHATFGKGYDDLCEDANLTHEALIASIESQIRLEPGVAAHWVTVVLDAMRRLLWSGVGGRGKPGAMPKMAIGLVFAALDVITEAMPNGRTMMAYRNRHTDFIEALSAYAAVLVGDRQDHGTFYAELGRKVAIAVLEHEEAPTRYPTPLPDGHDYAPIMAAALEKMVYFIGAGESGPIKIGIALEPHDRLAALQTAHHETLSILAITNGGREQELCYHQRFAAHRLKGEWFSRCPELMAEIEHLRWGDNQDNRDDRTARHTSGDR